MTWPQRALSPKGSLLDPPSGLSASLSSHGWTIHKAAVPLAMQPPCSSVPLPVQVVKRCPRRRFAVSLSGDKLICWLGPLPDSSTGLSAPRASHGWTIHKAAAPLATQGPERGSTKVSTFRKRSTRVELLRIPTTLCFPHSD